MKNLKDLQLKETEAFLEELGEPKFRAKQIFAWLYKGAKSFDDMTDIPSDLKKKLLEAKVSLGILKAEKVQISKLDGTRKYLFRLSDQNTAETVFMPYKYGNTVCISSQAGCRMGCRFCASTIDGLSRNLTAGEMSEQVLAAEREAASPVNHIVVMGMGEPFDNYDNLSKFIRIINDKAGRNLGMRNITVSTCGIVPAIRRFAADFPQVNLAISLHGPNNRIRSSMMPVNNKYPLEELIEECREYTKATSRRITFEYTLVKGVNDSPAHADELADLLKGMLCHVNLIPLNKVRETGLDTTARKDAVRFLNCLESRRIPATIRREMGDDIDGACGQLRQKGKK